MLVSMKAVLDIAEATNTAVGAFNITSFEGIQAVLSAAEELHQPVILQYAPVHGTIIALDVIGPVMVLFAKKAAVPVCVHLDHGDNLEDIKKALDLGFTSIMYDGSVLDFDSNVAYTKAAVELARQAGASVEAEIGAMGRQEFGSVGEEGDSVASSYTDPDMAEAFVKTTGIDALACSFGTVHGLYLTKPQLDFERISNIREKIGVPVVMHGGSGVSDEDFRKCIERGVRKINFYTYMAKAGGQKVRENCAKDADYVYFHDVTMWGIEGMKAEVVKAIRVFSNL